MNNVNTLVTVDFVKEMAKHLHQARGVPYHVCLDLLARCCAFADYHCLKTWFSENTYVTMVKALRWDEDSFCYDLVDRGPASRDAWAEELGRIAELPVSFEGRMRLHTRDE